MPVAARGKEPPVETLPLEERIRRRAYELYVLQGNQSGSGMEDWLEAEEEIAAPKSKPSAKTDFRTRQATS